MNIVVEGPDGSGKTTLIHYLLNSVNGFMLKSGEGPPKFPGEIIDRCIRYLSMDGYIMDRHPVISHSIYDQFRKEQEPIPEEIVKSFYRSYPIIIYCHGRIGSHELKAYDLPNHVKMVEEKDKQIRLSYDEWARCIVPRHFWYTPDSTQRITDLVKERLSHVD